MTQEILQSVVDKEKMIEYIITRKGQFSRVVYVRDCKTKKNSPNIKKMTISTVRAGINYESLSSVQMKRETGELPEENQGLPWGEWEIFPYIIKHNDKRYLRLYTSGDVNSTVQFFKDDEEVSREDVEPYLLSSEKRVSDFSEVSCFTIKLDDLVEIY